MLFTIEPVGCSEDYSSRFLELFTVSTWTLDPDVGEYAYGCVDGL